MMLKWKRRGKELQVCKETKKVSTLSKMLKIPDFFLTFND